MFTGPPLTNGKYLCLIFDHRLLIEQSVSMYSPRMSFDDRHASRPSSKQKNYHGSNASKNVRLKLKSHVCEQPVSLISVLLGLSALSKELGLLANPVFALLTESIKVELPNEVCEPISADLLLFLDKNSTMLATVAQKFIGLVESNLLSINQDIAVNRAIKNIATLLYNTSKWNPSGSDQLDAVSSLKLKKVVKRMFRQSMSANDPSEPVAKKMKMMKESQPEPQASTSASFGPQDKKPTSSNEQIVLSDDDLRLLLLNFVDLTSQEQSAFIMHVLRQISTEEEE